jgi:hypothetical protein
MFLLIGNEVNEKMKKLRMQYSATKSRLSQPARSGSGGSTAAKIWMYYDMLHFLDRFTLVRKGCSNFTQVIFNMTYRYCECKHLYTLLITNTLIKMNENQINILHGNETVLNKTEVDVSYHIFLPTNTPHVGYEVSL